MKSVNELCNGEFDVVFDLSLVRGQGYYTGTVFEVEALTLRVLLQAVEDMITLLASS